MFKRESLNALITATLLPLAPHFTAPVCLDVRGQMFEVGIVGEVDVDEIKHALRGASLYFVSYQDGVLTISTVFQVNDEFKQEAD